MDRLNGWLQREADREQRSARLESALLTGSFSEYFLYRLRYFAARALASSLIRTIKILFLFRVFSTGEFVAIVVAHAITAIVSDLWWGALEQMRGRIRHLQRTGSRHRIGDELGKWLRLSVRLTALGIGIALGYLAIRAAPRGRGPTVAELYVAAVVVGAAIELTVRTYHSGCYALRRVYRPLPSMVAADVVSLALLLATLPLIGEMAFPAAELIGVLVAAAVSVHYTAQTARLLGIPSLRTMLARARAIPRPRALLASLAPAFGYASIGIESLIVLTVLAGVGESTTKTSLVVFLSALSPAVRAGFEWARLLYFDLKRLELPMLSELRDRFDAAVGRLAVVLGVATWGIAALIASVILEIEQRGLLRALLPFFVARSILAAIQIRAFANGAYLRLVVVGIAGAVGFAAVIAWATTDTHRVLGLTVVLGIAAASLLFISEAAPPGETGTIPLTDWIGRLSATRGPVTVTSAWFDQGPPRADITAEARRTAQWREERIARRVRWRIKPHGGAVASPGRWHLIWFQRGPWTDAMRRDTDSWLVGATGGHLREAALHLRYPDGASAATHTIERVIGFGSPGQAGALDLTPPVDDDLAMRFRHAFPDGVVVDLAGRPSEALTRLSVADHRNVLRAAISYAETLEIQPSAGAFEVTSSSSRGTLRLMFLAPRSAESRTRMEWRAIVREANLRAAVDPERRWGMLRRELPFRGRLDGSRGR